jgi:aspartate racemase
VAPEGDALAAVHDSYIGMAMAGRVTDDQRRTLFAIGRQLCQARGAETILLGGTDMFLAFQGQDCGFPVLDCAEVHVEALYRFSARAA